MRPLSDLSYSKGPYKVRQRRTRVYGIATADVAESQENMARRFDACVNQLANIGTRFAQFLAFWHPKRRASLSHTS